MSWDSSGSFHSDHRVKESFLYLKYFSSLFTDLIIFWKNVNVICLHTLNEWN